ncbi:DegT/DnrJ/EryC1/StrS family aminotransferase [Alteromonas facilis]|uniref:DegT/DnrJ/EryC1/StrS family aminotransferase n=1 Tax=Alteromonas facilis TaxID=2048004 RepID=UPI000C282F89|nr:DegT/DnrJ/EryC1/StrS family aminotransferase [Alteromonas facilis]
MEFIDLNAQLHHMRSAIEERINKVLDHGQFIMGPEVYELEEQLANYVGVKHCVSCANGTDALQIALMCHDIGHGDVVFTTSFSFFATAEVIALTGATPYFVDIDPTTFNIDPVKLEAAIQAVRSSDLGEPKAVIAVDLFGLPANYLALEPMCELYGLTLIEDAAQGFGGSIGNRRSGSFGDIATTSFFPAKPLGCYGDGGALFTDNDETAEKMRSLRVHGKGDHKYQNIRIGLNSRLDTIQAAILIEKLAHFPDELVHRQAISQCYSAINFQCQKPEVPSGFTSSWAQYTLMVAPENRQAFQDQLKRANIPTAIYYPIPLDQQPAFSDALSPPTPIAAKVATQVISIPMSGYISLQDCQTVVDVINGLQN